ncbi:MAG: hypothetical protein RLO52_41330 [Sandaracinaceae bacterium]
MRTIICFACVALALGGCGTRTTLSVSPRDDGGAPPPGDGGRDSGVDSGVDSGMGGLIVDCGAREQFTTPRRALTVEASAESEDGVTFSQWTLLEAPRASMPRFMVDGPFNATLTPDLEGAYRLQFEARDGGGRTATCEVTVNAVVGPPVAICPDGMQQTLIDEPIVLLGDGFDDDFVVSFQWDVVSMPPGASPMLTGVDGPVLEFRSRTRGSYVLRLTVTDPDMATDSCEVGVLVTGPPEVVCPADATGPTRQPIRLNATATDDLGIRTRRWEVIRRPASSSAEPTPADADATTITPDRVGAYTLRFTATDVEGLSASCEVDVTATPSPPTLTCPGMVMTEPLRPTPISVSAVDDGTVVSWRWRLTSTPGGSGATAPSPANAPMTTFTPDIAGVYELTVTATDDDGLTGMCTVRVEAGNVDGLRVEMFWDTDSTDMDLHLMRPGGTQWNTTDDCYYGNCIRGGPDWGGPGTDDNPRLDIDDTNGRGPENINILRPAPGTYRVGVHSFSGGGPHAITVRIYCGGSDTTPRQTLGPVTLNERTGGRFWRVADVSIDAAGCRITDLAGPAGPNVGPFNRGTR